MLNIPDDVEHILNEKEFDICKFLTRKQLGKLLKDTKVIQNLNLWVLLLFFKCISARLPIC